MTEEKGKAVPLRIGLPLPLDIMNTVVGLVGRAYPSSTMGMGTYDQMVIFVDPDDRRDLTDEDVAEAIAPFSNETVESVGEESMTFSSASSAGHHLAEVCKAMLDTDVVAENYVEVEVQDKATGQRYVVVACRSLGQTPHALHKEAERGKQWAIEQARQAGVLAQAQIEGHGQYIADTILAMCSSTHEQPCSPCQTAAHLAKTTPPNHQPEEKA